MPDSTTHRHLCNICVKEFDCSGAGCAEFEFQTCPKTDCQAKQKASSRPARRKAKR